MDGFPAPSPDGGPSTADPSLELLYRHHRAWLLKAVRKRFGTDQAEDLVQETFVRAASYPPGDVRNPRGLLIQIATRAAIDRERRRRVRAPLQDLDAERAESAADQAEALALKQVILSLPRPLKETFLLSRFGGLTYEEIAIRFGISVKTVEWRMTKALKLCARKLGG